MSICWRRISNNGPFGQMIGWLTPAVPADLKGAVQTMAFLRFGFLGDNASGRVGF